MLEISAGIIAICSVVAVIKYLSTSEHAWDIDAICWFEVRDKILKNRYAGVQYSMLQASTPVIIRHREPLPMKDRLAIRKLFPKDVRLEFQQVFYEGEQVTLYGQGNMIQGPVETIPYPIYGGREGEAMYEMMTLDKELASKANDKLREMTSKGVQEQRKKDLET